MYLNSLPKTPCDYYFITKLVKSIKNNISFMNYEISENLPTAIINNYYNSLNEKRGNIVLFIFIILLIFDFKYHNNYFFIIFEKLKKDISCIQK